MIFDLNTFDPRCCPSSNKPEAPASSSITTTRMMDIPPHSFCSDLWFLSESEDAYSRSRSRSSSYSTTTSSTRPNRAGQHVVSPTSSPGRKKERKDKVPLKLEMCESVVKGVDCVFGAKCTFAHCESELQLRTLRERAEAGIVDIMTYRTRPCLYHVMTGGW